MGAVAGSRYASTGSAQLSSPQNKYFKILQNNVFVQGCAIR